MNSANFSTIPDHKRKHESVDQDLGPIAKRTRLATKLALEASAMYLAEAESEPSFHLFAAFPAEIQMLVWEYVPATRRAVNIWGNHVIVENDQDIAPNPIAQVCKSARKITKQRMISVLRPVVRRSFDTCFVPFDFDTVWDVALLTGASHQMNQHLFPKDDPKQSDVFELASTYLQLPTINMLKISSPIPWEGIRTIVVGAGLKWKEVRKMSDEDVETMKAKIRELFPRARRIFIASSVDSSCPRRGNIQAKVIAADEIEGLGERRKIYFETEGVEKQLSTLRRLGDGQFFLESRYIPNEDDLDLDGSGGGFNFHLNLNLDF